MGQKSEFVRIPLRPRAIGRECPFRHAMPPRLMFYREVVRNRLAVYRTETRVKTPALTFSSMPAHTFWDLGTLG